MVTRLVATAVLLILMPAVWAQSVNMSIDHTGQITQADLDRVQELFEGRGGVTIHRVRLEDPGGAKTC